eukprot:TRINITY_DN29401_c0_g2_i1.p1 TRINITY_DN29401_c0_g2~~TRINITY_DN29401_c0_g2_i1.p1  ORF type:complete len:271 (+),score=80.74 TRINITY_DN29401_c0_g2_i1:315-1127(+)
MKASGYDTFRSKAPGGKEIAECLATVGAGLDVLDLGCGTGAFFTHLRNLEPRSMLATDLNEAMVDKAKKVAMELTGTNDWVQATLTDHLPECSFDFIFCGQVIQNLTSEPEEAPGARAGFYQEIMRLLKPGGKLVLTTRLVPPGGRWSDLYWYADPEVLPEAVANMEAMVPEDPVAELRETGFENVELFMSEDRMIRADAYKNPSHLCDPAFRAGDSFFQHVHLKNELPQLLENVARLDKAGELEAYVDKRFALCKGLGQVATLSAVRPM